METLKSIFPYKFALRDNLFYKGNTPNVSYYKDISAKDSISIYSHNWSFQDETIKYLENNLNSLYEILTKANNQLFEDYNINIMEASTISVLAVWIFLNKYYKNNIPIINKSSIYTDIKKWQYYFYTKELGELESLYFDLQSKRRTLCSSSYIYILNNINIIYSK